MKSLFYIIAAFTGIKIISNLLYNRRFSRLPDYEQIQNRRYL